MFRTFDYFKSTLEDPTFELFSILDNSSHQEYNNLRLDLKEIDSESLAKFVEDRRIDRLLINTSDIDEGRRAYYLIESIRKEVAHQRLLVLIEDTKKPLPYTSGNLHEISILNNSLVSVSDFEIFRYGYRYHDMVYALSPTLPSANSSYWISMAIMKLRLELGLNIKIRLDPFIEIPYTEFNQPMYLMQVYGKKLDWKRISRIRDDEHGRWMEDEGYSKYEFTDYVWHPNNEEIHFTCEELPRRTDIAYRGSRYFHAIIDKETGIVKHCDGALRVYSDVEFSKRLDYHVKNAEVRKIGKRVKIFQIDEPIERDVFSFLITNFMVWNEDVISYFN